MSKLFDLKDKVVMIVGSSSGLGADAARAFAEAGANLALLARRKDRLDELVAELKSPETEAIAVTCDVTDEESVKNAVEKVIGEYGKIDVLFNNAGTGMMGSVETLTQEDWQRAMDINLAGMFLMSKYVVPHMKERKYGKIINTASVNAIVADKDDNLVRHVYNASKAGVIGLTKGMAASYAKYGITVNAVGPGLFETEMTKNNLFKSEDFLNYYNMVTPMGRPANKGELNGPLLFFASDASSYVTGQFLVVDGGATIV